MKSITLEGEVIKELISKGSKSEHEAVLLVVDEDTRYKLGRRGGHPFQDDELEGLVGKYISARGMIQNHSFIVESYQEKKQNQ